MRFAVVFVALLAVGVATLWQPVARLDSVAFEMDRLPNELTPNSLIPDNVQSFFTGQLEAPEHFAFDKKGDIYFGVHDGRILRTRPDASGKLAPLELVVYLGNPKLVDRGEPCGTERSENVCGRPLGMTFDAEGKLLVADCYLGVFEVDVEARTKRLLLSEVDGTVLYFPNSIVVGPKSGKIYFTDSTNRWRRREFIYEVMESQYAGRVIEFDRKSNTAKVLVHNIAFANGILVDPVDEKYLLFNELNRARVLRLDLEKHSANAPSIDSFAVLGEAARNKGKSSSALSVAVPNLPGIPDNLFWEEDKTSGVFWIGAGTARTQPLSLTDALASLPTVRNVMTAVLPKSTFLTLVPKIGLLFRVQLDAARQHGHIVTTLQDKTGGTSLLTGAYEHDGYLYLGAISHDVRSVLRVPWGAANKTAPPNYKP